MWGVRLRVFALVCIGLTAFANLAGGQEIFADGFEWVSICAWSNLWYTDLDDDGYGADGAAGFQVGCPPPDLSSSNDMDCDDDDPLVPVACPPGSCGLLSDGCGGQISCGGCEIGQVCHDNQCCTQASCAGLGLQCGTYSDGCGGSMDCGSCLPSQICLAAGTCCTPTTCAGLPGQCGTLSDDCGGFVSCACSPGQVCHNNECCTPANCASLGVQCGIHSDGCGGSIDCGSCPSE